MTEIASTARWRRRLRSVCLVCALAAAPAIVLVPSVLRAANLPPGYWPATKADAILEKTLIVRLAPDLSALTQGERAAINDLIEVGKLLQVVYEDSRHPEAIHAMKALLELHQSTGRSPETAKLLDLYRLFQGPIAATLDNTREPMLPVSGLTPTRNVYPAGATAGQVDAFLAQHPEERDAILGERTVVRRTTSENLIRDVSTLAAFPVLDTLHPGLGAKLQQLADAVATGDSPFYAVPQSIQYAEPMMQVYRLLNSAASSVEKDDPEFARYLRNRGRDLLSDDYESGDASWVTGRFRHLNAQIGSYETYDDALYGVKAFQAVSILLRNEAATEKLRKATAGLQAIEDSLPSERHKRVREDIPVGVYEVIADFGQARGGNTATILPNDTLFARRYGRTILLRENIMRDEGIFANSRAAWNASVAPAFAADLVPEGNFHRTLWHEIGHYLGVDSDRQGRMLDAALGQNADALEELKADLVALFAIPALRKAGYYDDAIARTVYASGVMRTLLNNQPRRDQPYQTMELIQFNWFLDERLLELDRNTKTLVVHYDRYQDVVAALLKEVLAIQDAGDGRAAEDFVVRWTKWTPDVHDVIAQKIRDNQKYRYTLVKYAALGE